MIEATKESPPRQPPETGGTKATPNDTALRQPRQAPPRNQSCGASVTQQVIFGHIDRAIEAERQLAICGWFNPRGLYQVAGQYGLYGNRFADQVCGYLHAYVVNCYEQKRKPDVDHAAAEADYLGVDVTAYELLT